MAKKNKKYIVSIRINDYIVEAKNETELCDIVEQDMAELVMDSKFIRDYVEWKEIED